MSKKMIEQLWKTMAKGALTVAGFSANTSCSGFVYQPKLPKAVKKLRNF